MNERRQMAIKTPTGASVGPLPVRSDVLQRKCACGDMAGPKGKCSSCRRTGGLCKPLQAKMRSGKPGDRYEQEADRVAEQVMCVPEPVLKRQVDEIEEMELLPAKPIVQRRVASDVGGIDVPPIVHEVLRSPGKPLDPKTRAFMESRVGHDFNHVRIHTDARAAESARAVGARGYTVGTSVVLDSEPYALQTFQGRRLLAHELTHVVQQASSASNHAEINQPEDVYKQEDGRIAEQVTGQITGIPPDMERDSGKRVQPKLASGAFLPAIQYQSVGSETQEEKPVVSGATEEEGIEVGGELMILPRWRIVTLPGGAASHACGVMSAISRLSPAPALQRADGGAGGLSSSCDSPTSMRKVKSGKFEGGKTLDDYFPDLVGKKFWGSKDTAGPFDNGVRAGSAVQLIGEYPSPCPKGGSVFTLGQTAKIIRARADGKKLMEGGKPLEGQTLDDIKRSGRDQSKPPFRQEFSFAVSMADPISGIPYNTLKSYEFEVDLTSSLSGPGGSKSVDWGMTTEASGGKVTKNELR